MGSSESVKYSLITELMRKLIHMNGIFIVIMYELLDKRITLLVLTIALVIALEIEYFRIEWGKRIKIIDVLFRQKEKKTLGGHVFLAIGAIIAISVFSKEVAVLAILMTVVGDAAAAIIGRMYGKHFISGLENKAYEGVFAEFFSDVVVGSVYLIVVFGGITLVYGVVLVVMAAVATLIETLTNKLDDNLLVPVFSGIMGESILFFVPMLMAL